jgi:dihydroorotate dehydrogenase (NAD+) catalytic subunit
MPRGVTVLAKVAPEVHHVVDVARAAVKSGADGVVVGHGLPGLALDPRTLRPALGSGTGDLSGPAVHAVALRCIWEVHSAMPEVLVVGSGGIRTGFDALAMLAAGAGAVQVGSTVLHDPGAPARVVSELRDELTSRGIPSVADAIGRAHRPEGEPR